MRFVIAVVGMLMTCMHCSGPARADDHVAFALKLLCGSRGVALAPTVQSEAERAGVDPVKLASVIAAESTCRADAINARTGSVGLGAILPEGSANPNNASPAELEDPATNVRLTAEHLARCLALCGAFGPAVSVYNGSKRCRATAWSRYVLRLLPQALERWIKGRRS